MTKGELLAVLDTHSVTGYQCNRALRRIIEDFEPGPEPQWSDRKYNGSTKSEYQHEADHARWQALTEVQAAILEELQHGE